MSECICRRVVNGVHPFWCPEVPLPGEVRQVVPNSEMDRLLKMKDVIVEKRQKCGCRFLGASHVESCRDHL